MQILNKIILHDQVDFILGIQEGFIIHIQYNKAQNRHKDSNHIFISEKALGKIQLPFMIKVIYTKPTANIIINGGILKA